MRAELRKPHLHTTAAWTARRSSLASSSYLELDTGGACMKQAISLVSCSFLLLASAVAAPVFLEIGAGLQQLAANEKRY